ncbi:recombinase family protein, partial [Eubacteriales bacterium OttesenSCG-928-A19]|nr:recombinase family protein [Eubacteriales bacterium OttesenSCG-928-A19]
MPKQEIIKGCIAERCFDLTVHLFQLLLGFRSGYEAGVLERSLRNYAKKWRYEIVDVVSECECGTSLERPGFHKLYELTRSDSVDIILTTDVSTLCRNVRDSIQFCLDIKEHDVDVISTSHGSLSEIADAL